MISDSELNNARISLFSAIVGCECFFCTCNHWQRINIDTSEITVSNEGLFNIPDEVFYREQDRILSMIEEDRL